MIRILFIVPYPEMRKKAEYVLQHFSEADRLEVKIVEKRVEEVEDFADISFDSYDVIIARGYSAILLAKKVTRIPTIRINISAYDIIRAIAEAVKLYNPEKIAFCATEQKMYEVEEISSYLHMNLIPYDSVRHEELDQIVMDASQKGCSCMIGGYSACLCAQQNNMHAVIVKSGENTIQQALEEAVRTVDRNRQAQITSEMYKTIIYSSQDGVLYVDRDGVIRVRNYTIRNMNSGKSLMNTMLHDSISFLEGMFRKTIDSGRAQQSIVLKIPGTKITASVSSVPVIANGELSGVVLRVQDITQIQNLEGQIRRKLSERGLNAKYHFKDIVHESTVMDEAVEMAVNFAASDSNVIVVGETGTGKELFAQSIHNESKRKNGPFVVINCAALPENLLESELFGYSEGAFTGASKGGKIGLFEQAHGGTLFLDEIGEISMSTQTKLLRVLQERQVRRIGDNRVIDVDVRIISATNRNLQKLCEQGKFRRDLMYRLDVLRLFVPPLRDRENDVELLFRNLLTQLCTEYKEEALKVDPGALKLLYRYPFYGNIRELRNIVERLLAMCKGKTIHEQDLFKALYPKELDMYDDVEAEHLRRGFQYAEQHASDGEQESVSASGPIKNAGELEETEKICQVLKQYRGNRSAAAAALGIDRTTLWRKIKKLHIQE